MVSTAAVPESDTKTATVTVNDVRGLLSRFAHADELIATAGDANSIERLVEGVENLGEGTTVRAVVDGEALDSVGWATRGRAEGLRREGRLAVRTDDLGSLGNGLEAISDGDPATWARTFSDNAVVAEGVVDLEAHRERLTRAAETATVADCTLSEYRHAVTEEIDAETAEVAVRRARETDVTTATILAVAEFGGSMQEVVAAVEACGVSSCATAYRRRESLEDDREVETVPLASDSRGTETRLELFENVEETREYHCE